MYFPLNILGDLFVACHVSFHGKDRGKLPVIFQDVDDASMEIADAKLPYGYEPRDKSWEMVMMVGRKGCEIQENLGESRIFRYVFLICTSILKSWLRYHQS